MPDSIRTTVTLSSVRTDIDDGLVFGVAVLTDMVVVDALGTVGESLLFVNAATP